MAEPWPNPTIVRQLSGNLESRTFNNSYLGSTSGKSGSLISQFFFWFQQPNECAFWGDIFTCGFFDNRATKKSIIVPQETAFTIIFGFSLRHHKSVAIPYPGEIRKFWSRLCETLFDLTSFWQSPAVILESSQVTKFVTGWIFSSQATIPCIWPVTQIAYTKIAFQVQNGGSKFLPSSFSDFHQLQERHQEFLEFISYWNGWVSVFVIPVCMTS